MSENTSMIIGYTITGILFIILGYKVFMKVKDVPNKMIQLLYTFGLVVIGIGLYCIVNRGVPFMYKIVTSLNNAEIQQDTYTSQTQMQATGNIQSGTNVSGVVFNDTPPPKEEIVSWTTLQEKIKHVPISERHGSTAGN